MVTEEQRREVEESEVRQEDGMTARRAWNWNLHEMRKAAMMANLMVDETMEDSYPAPTVSGFTPINHCEPSDGASIHAAHGNTAIEATGPNKPRAPKRRKTQPRAATTVAKPKKPASSKNTKRTKTAAQLNTQDISQGLLRTKPTVSANESLHAKNKSSFENIRFEHPGPWRIDDTTVESQAKPARTGLADKYQAAYPNVRTNVVNGSTPPTPPKSDEVEAEVTHTDESQEQDSATEPTAKPNNHLKPFIQENPASDGSVTVRDFGAPPFTQASSPTLRDPISPATMMLDEYEPMDSTLDDLFPMGDIENGNCGGEDEFPVDDECLEEMMQSIAAPAEEQTLISDWQSQNFSDNTLYDDEQPETDSHWPGALPDSDGMILHDDDPTLVASDIIDAPSSPQWSSQASCILTHITGNANPDRAKSAEGSENCFDDHDLDDGLVDLTVDEPQSLQTTSPVTPAKRSLSPKLKWLPPKIYTPAKPPTLSVSPTDEPHVVPMDAYGDALPFIRPPFPKAIRDRSPILGLSNRTVLRLCFRIGEALNAAAVASRTNVDAIIELYARVVTSSREAGRGYKQSFLFGDLFTDKPPYLGGTYTVWKGVGLWDHDSRELVGEQGRGKMVRVLGRIKKKEPAQGQGPGVEMAVLSIWEVDWEDVGIAKGIVCFKKS